MCETCDSEKQTIQGMPLAKLLEMHEAQVIAMNKQYLKSLKTALKYLDTLSKKKDKDRMDYNVILTSIITLLVSSCQGWHKYNNAPKLNTLFATTEDIKQVVEKMLVLTKEWVKIDMEVTSNEIKKLEQKSKKSSSKKKRKSSKTKTTYVA